MIRINDKDRPGRPNFFSEMKIENPVSVYTFKGSAMQSRLGAFFGERFGPSEPLKSRKVIHVVKQREKNILCGHCLRKFATESNLHQHAKLQQGPCLSAYEQGLSGSRRAWKAAKAHMKALS